MGKKTTIRVELPEDLNRRLSAYAADKVVSAGRQVPGQLEWLQKSPKGLELWRQIASHKFSSMPVEELNAMVRKKYREDVNPPGPGRRKFSDERDAIIVAAIEAYLSPRLVVDEGIEKPGRRAAS